MAHRSPDLRVLDLNGGTLSVTDQLIRTLTTSNDGTSASPTPRFGRYDCTAGSADLLSVIKDKYSKYSSPDSRVNFSVLNIQNDPQVQEFECGSYDVVVASDVSQKQIQDYKSLKPSSRFFILLPSF